METRLAPAPCPGPVAEGPPSRKRQQVIQAAAELFIAQGYGAVSMDAVARAAGVSKATLYAHFTSKDALFATIVGEAARQGPVEAAQMPAQVENVEAALRALGGKLLRFLLEPRTVAIARVAIAESARFPELGAAFLASGPMAFQTQVAIWLGRLHAQGAIHAPDADLAAQHLGALLRGTLHIEALLTPGFAPDEARIEAAVQGAVGAFLRAYAPQ
jgi:TetR/AcrR family transcriptional repressor of mexJK operon